MIVLRDSPDWLQFDAEQSRAFCLRHHLPETTVIDFIRLWDAEFRVPYRRVRHDLKSIASATIHKVQNASVMSWDALAGLDPALLAPDGLAVFTDDDDWLAPGLFDMIRQPPRGPDGVLWGSVFLGKMAVDTPVEKAESAVLQLRPLNDTVFTNNYAVSSTALSRLGIPALLEHADAQRSLNDKSWRPSRRDARLSLANKHPCCTVAAFYNMQSPTFRERPREFLSEFVQELTRVPLPPDGSWIAEPMRAFSALMQQCLE